MKLWQILALISGAIIAVVMALASVSYNATLGTDAPAFSWLPFLTNAFVFSALALAFDLGMIASVFGVLHWHEVSRLKAAVCAVLFVIASLFSIHSVRGYIALNVTTSLTPAARSQDLYASLKTELSQDQIHLAELRTALLTASRRERKSFESRVNKLAHKIDDTRNRLAHMKVQVSVSPLVGLDWFLAITLWFFNATCWTAWFGAKPKGAIKSNDTVSTWLAQHDLTNPQHCDVLYGNYKDWCLSQKTPPLPQYSFYARLIELGARKFRDGRNGPTKYVMPAHGT